MYSSNGRSDLHHLTTALPYSIFEKNIAMMTKVLESLCCDLILARSAYFAGLTSPLMLLVEVQTRIIGTKDCREACAIMTTFLNIVKENTAHKFMTKRIGKH